MANEFVAKNGLISQNNTIVSGSLTVTQGITGSFSGSIVGYVLTDTTSSFATTGSNTFNGNQTITGSLNVTQGITGSTQGTASWATNAVTASEVLVTNTTSGTGPYYVAFTQGTTGDQAILVDSNGLLFNATTNTLTVTSSFATTASYALVAGSGDSGGGGLTTGQVIAIATGNSNLF